MAFRDSEKSRVFVKVTKTKVLAAYGQLIEVLFSQGKFPIGIFPTKVPSGVSEYAHIKPDNMKNPRMEDIYGFEGDGREMEPGATADSILNGLAEKYAKSITIGSGQFCTNPGIIISFDSHFTPLYSDVLMMSFYKSSVC